MLQVFHRRQGPSKPREGKADTDKGHIRVMAPNVRKYRPQSDHVERSDLAKRFFIAG
jgi:hypothetical protein